MTLTQLPPCAPALAQQTSKQKMSVLEPEVYRLSHKACFWARPGHTPSQARYPTYQGLPPLVSGGVWTSVGQLCLGGFGQVAVCLWASVPLATRIRLAREDSRTILGLSRGVKWGRWLN